VQTVHAVLGMAFSADGTTGAYSVRLICGEHSRTIASDPMPADQVVPAAVRAALEALRKPCRVHFVVPHPDIARAIAHRSWMPADLLRLAAQHTVSATFLRPV